MHYVTYTTPTGPFTMIFDEEGIVSRTGFLAAEELWPGAVEAKNHPYVALLERYFSGDVTALDDISYDQTGPSFRVHVWMEMSKIPAGSVSTYTELAAAAGNPKAIRAAGTACATNQLPVLVPCHRVVPKGGGFGNYAYGTDVKRYLLTLEGYSAAAA